MRLLQLSFTAFGPYCEKQTLDFSDLKDARLFLIHGPTGAGKTTILDAICFAFYGETSGDERIGRQMRSDLADEALFTEVTLDFQIGKEIYRIYRSPEQDRPKRGGGVTKDPHNATLWRRTEAKDAEEGEVLAARVREVNLAIADLLGFSAQEFRQVVMLPQGRFREMLTAGSDERQKILQTLFQTGIYKRIEQTLKDKSRDTSRAMEALRNKEAGILEQAEAASEDDLKLRLKDTKKNLDQVNGEVTKLSKKEGKHRLAKAAAETVQEKLDAVSNARTAFEELEKQKPEQDEYKKTHKAAEAAEQIEGAYQSLTEAEDECTNAEGEFEEAKTNLSTATNEQKVATNTLSREKGRDKERAAATRKVDELDRHKNKIGRITKAREVASAAANKWNDANNHFIEMLEAEEDAAEVLNEIEDELKFAHEAELSLDGLKAKVDKAKSDLSIRERLEALLIDEPAAREKYSTAETNALQLGKQKDAKVKALRAAEDAHWSSAASYLAGDLEDGKPCPVCGSLDHPAPTKAGNTASADVSLIDLRAELDRLAKEHTDANGVLSDLKGNSEKLSDELKGLRQTLKKGVQNGVDAFGNRASAAERTWKSAQALARQKSNLVKGVSQAKKELKKTQKAVVGAKEKLKTAENNDTTAKALVTERESEIPKKLRDPEALDEALDDAREHVASLENALTVARSEAEQAGNEEASAKAAKNAAGKNFTRIKNRLKRQKSSFEAAFKGKGFKNEEAFLLAQLDKKSREDLKREIENFDDDYRDVKALLKQSVASAKGLKTPNLDALQSVWEDARDLLDEAKDKRAGLRNLKKDTQDTIKRLKALRKEFDALDKLHRCEGYLAEVASGKNERNLSFERFILATWLDEVLQAANQRFDIMSRGRYLLQRQEEVTHGLKAAGLNLAVLDSYTDRPRPVATLSGGEGFLAALSLALGVVDVVQRYAGGTVIDTLFIDEGFGNLDSEALDAAMQALVDLQTSGRLIGVISHVREMEERIEAKLKVMPGKNGNHAQFVVP